MFDFLKRKVPCHGAVLFPGSLPPRADVFRHLEKRGVTISSLNVGKDEHWGLRMEHPEWGEAFVICPRNPPRPPENYFDHTLALSEQERVFARTGESTVLVRLETVSEAPLRDRKMLLRFLHAILGTDGVVAIDNASWLPWSPAALNDELAHDADLDVEALYTLHAVQEAEDRPVTWLHSHGLADLGAFDFDILRPSDAVLQLGSDLHRAIAFAILEGSVKMSTPRFELAEPGGVVSFVEVRDFNRRAAPEETALRGDADDPDHNRNRSVLCDVRRGLRGRLFGGVRASRFLSSPLPDQGIFRFSNTATHLMADRARNTCDVFRQLADEFAEFECPILAKFGYPIDGGHEDHREHMWFSVNAFGDGEIDATLEVQPFQIERMNQGDRGRHPVDLLTDWLIITPMGHIHPRSLAVARRVREHIDALRAFMRDQKSSND